MPRNRIEKLLQPGDRRTSGKSGEAVIRVLARPRLLADLIKAVQSDSPPIRMRAADAVEKISRKHPEWLLPYKRVLINKISRIPQQEVRWHVAQILPRLHLSQPERKKVYGLLLDYLEDKSRIVKTFTLQAMAELAIEDDSYRSRTQGLLCRVLRTGSPAMKARARILLKHFRGSNVQ